MWKIFSLKVQTDVKDYKTLEAFTDNSSFFSFSFFLKMTMIEMDFALFISRLFRVMTFDTKQIWNRVGCQRFEIRSKTHKRLKRTLFNWTKQDKIWQNRTKQTNSQSVKRFDQLMGFIQPLLQPIREEIRSGDGVYPILGWANPWRDLISSLSGSFVLFFPVKQRSL